MPSIDPTVVQDVVVIVPGIMGTELVDARGRAVWSVSVGTLARAIRTLGRSLTSLELPKGIGDEAPDDGIRPGGLMTSLHVVPGLWSPITGYDGLLDFLRSDRFHLVEEMPGNSGIIPNLIQFPYDWRLSNRYNGRRLAKVASDALERWRKQPGMGEAKLVLICHSMGGLIARWFADQEGGADLIRSIITVGTPFRGAARAVVTLVNGLKPGLGPLRLPLSGFVQSLPSLYQLLPQYDCLVEAEGRKGLATGQCPGLDSTMLKDAIAFHEAIAGRAGAPYTMHKVVGIRQPTLTTARVVGTSLEASFDIDGNNQGGDGTVPRMAAEPVIGRGQETHEIAGQHGELQGARSLQDLVDGILTRAQIVWQAAATTEGFGIEMDEIWSTAGDVQFRVTDMNNRRLLATARNEEGTVVRKPFPVPPHGSLDLGRLPEGGYRLEVASPTPNGPPAVVKPFVVFDPDSSE
jgi:pimeloyl-ACP methyl ester carboxylesterase